MLGLFYDYLLFLFMEYNYYLPTLPDPPQPLENTGQTPAKVTLADLGFPWQIESRIAEPAQELPEYSGRSRVTQHPPTRAKCS